MITVHHLTISQSERIVWLCEELELPYTLERYERDAATHLAPDAYRALHPIGTSPVISDGELVLAESGAIIEYLVTRYGGGGLSVSAEQPGYTDYLFWFHFANGSMMPYQMASVVAPAAFKLGDRAARAWAMVEERLGEVPYFAGERFTAADIMMGFPLTTFRAFTHRDLTSFPNVQAYLSRIGERPAYQRAWAKSQPGLPPFLKEQPTFKLPIAQTGLAQPA